MHKDSRNRYAPSRVTTCLLCGVQRRYTFWLTYDTRRSSFILVLSCGVDYADLYVCNISEVKVSAIDLLTLTYLRHPPDFFPLHEYIICSLAVPLPQICPRSTKFDAACRSSNTDARLAPCSLNNCWRTPLLTHTQRCRQMYKECQNEPGGDGSSNPVC